MQVIFCDGQVGFAKPNGEMKSFLLILVAISLLGIAAFYGVSLKTEKQGSQSSDGISFALKSSRRPAQNDGTARSGSRGLSLEELRSSWQALLPARGESLFDEKISFGKPSHNTISPLVKSGKFSKSSSSVKAVNSRLIHIPSAKLPLLHGTGWTSYLAG